MSVKNGKNTKIVTLWVQKDEADDVYDSSFAELNKNGILPVVFKSGSVPLEVSMRNLMANNLNSMQLSG